MQLEVFQRRYYALINELQLLSRAPETIERQYGDMVAIYVLAGRPYGKEFQSCRRRPCISLHPSVNGGLHLLNLAITPGSPGEPELYDFKRWVREQVRLN